MSLARTASLLALGRIGQALGALLLPFVLVRVLVPQEQYGLVKQIDLAAALLLPFLVFGLDKSVTYFVPRKESDPAREVSTAVTAVLTACLLVFVLALLLPSVFAKIFATADLRLLALAAAGAGVAGAIMQMGSRALIATGSGGLAAALPLIVGLPRVAAVILLAWKFRSVQAVLGTFLAFSLLEIAVVLAVLVAKGLFRPRFHTEVFRRQIGFGGILALVSVANSWANRMDRVIVQKYLPLAAFTVYSVGKTNIPFMGILPLALDDATAPRFSRLQSEDRLEEMGLLWRKRAEALLPLNILVAAALASTAHWIIPLWFTEGLEAAVPVFRVAVLSLLIQACGGIELVLRALAALKFLTGTVLMSLLLRVVLGIAVVTATGSLALMAAVHVVVTVSILALRLTFLRRWLGVGWSTILPHEGLLAPVLMASGGLLATFLVDRLLGESLWASLAVAGMIWGGLLSSALWRQGLWRKILSGRRREGEGS